MSDTRELLNQRGWDLLRQMRMKLHEEDLITDEEYALLAVDHPAVKRLENYDVLRQQVESLRAACAEAYQFCGAAGANDKLLDNFLALSQGEKAPHEEWPICTGEWTFAACGHTSAVGCQKCAEQQGEALRAELSASAEVIKQTQDIYDDTVRECLEVRGQLDAEKQRADALEADKERLDWIEKNKTDLEHEDPIGEFQMLEPWRCHGHYSHDMRQAIDAARKPVPQEP